MGVGCGMLEHRRVLGLVEELFDSLKTALRSFILNVEPAFGNFGFIHPSKY